MNYLYIWAKARCHLLFVNPSLKAGAIKGANIKRFKTFVNKPANNHVNLINHFNHG